MRLFVGVWPSPSVRDALRALPRGDHPAVRWTTEDQWHVTLRFLGELDEGRLPALRAALDHVGAEVAPRGAVLGPTTARLGRGNLVAPVTGVDDLGEAVAQATRPIGGPEARRPFAGHLTVARGRGRRPVPPALAGAPIDVRWRIGAISLVASTLHVDGARYRDVHVVPLRGGTPGEPAGGAT